MNKHPQKKITFGKTSASVDVEIAPLIKELWKADLDTIASCQEWGEHGHIWILFSHISSLEQFLSIIFTEVEEEVESLYNRAVGSWEPKEWKEFREKRKWGYMVDALDIDNLDDDVEMREPPCIILNGSVYFPHTDLAMVLKRMQQHNELLN